MRHLFLTSIAVLCLLSACQIKPDLDAASAEVLAKWEDSKAVLAGDMEALLQDHPEGHVSISVGQGELQRMSRKDMAEVPPPVYTSIEDLDDPVVGVSPDGQMAWMAGRTKFMVEYTDDDGKTQGYDFVDAWVWVVEKRNGRWIDVLSADTFPPPAE